MSQDRSFKSFLLGSAISICAMAHAHASTLVFCSEGAPDGFDPALYTSSTTFDASSRQIYDRLVEYGRETTELEPGLAESWSVSEDGLEYTFKLRAGVKFHKTSYFTPTRDFNADDVLFSFERQLRRKHPWHSYKSGTGWEYFKGQSMSGLLRKIEAVDELTVKITLRQADTSILAKLAMDFGSIMSTEYADQVAEKGKKTDLNSAPIGTGPFVFSSYDQETEIRYEAHEGYWRKAPTVERLIFDITPDNAERLKKLKSGECQVMAHPGQAELDNVRTDDALKLQEQVSLDVGYLAYNTSQAPFNDKAVRKALNQAINKEAILESVYQGAGVVAASPLSPAMWSHNGALEQGAFDPEKAKEALAALEISGLSFEIWPMPVARPYLPDAEKAAGILQLEFSNIGVSTETVSYKWGAFLTRSKNKKRDGAILFGTAATNGDPADFLRSVLSCDAVGDLNRAQWCNEEFDGLLDEARNTSSQKEREVLLKKAQEIFAEEAPWATFAHSLHFAPVSAEIKGDILDPFGGHRFDQVELSE